MLVGQSISLYILNNVNKLFPNALIFAFNLFYLMFIWFMGTFTHKSYETKYTNNEKLSNIHELMQKMVRSKQLLHKTMANKDSKDKVNQYSLRFLDTAYGQNL